VGQLELQNQQLNKDWSTDVKRLEKEAKALKLKHDEAKLRADQKEEALRSLRKEVSSTSNYAAKEKKRAETAEEDAAVTQRLRRNKGGDSDRWVLVRGTSSWAAGRRQLPSPRHTSRWSTICSARGMAVRHRREQVLIWDVNCELRMT
jgi:hypothetical protein